MNPSTDTELKDAGNFESPEMAVGDLQGSAGGGWSYAGRNLQFGVREHGMGAILNGLAAHGGIIPFGATFLTFSDYLRPSIRLAALMELQVVYVFTHDSIGMGEDGPTHQSVEQVASLRAIPQLIVIRPADANETAVAWRVAIETRDRPVALVLTRQNVPTLDRKQFAPSGRSSSRGIHSGRRARWQTALDPDREWIGSRLDRGGGTEIAGTENSGAPGFHAELGIV